MRNPLQSASYFCCPVCRGTLHHEGSDDHPVLHCGVCKKNYAYRDGVWCFLEGDHYTSSFGFQWNQHAKTQLDKFSGLSISAERFYRQTGWTKEDLKGKNILEIGSGAGRFTEIALEAGANVFSLDASSAVFANAKNNDHERLCLIQASLYQQPFREAFFDFMFCFGVIQHTPDVRKTFRKLFQFLKPGGKFCVDVYASPIAYLHPRHLIRPVTRKMRPERLYRLVEKTVPVLLPLSNLCHKIPFAGEALARLIPVANWRYLNLKDKDQYREWAVLDTFDWLSPDYEKPQNHRRLETWCRELNLRKFAVNRNRGIHIVRGER